VAVSGSIRIGEYKDKGGPTKPRIRLPVDQVPYRQRVGGTDLQKTLAPICVFVLE